MPLIEVSNLFRVLQTFRDQKFRKNLVGLAIAVLIAERSEATNLDDGSPILS